jgi:hypothetical protein
LMTRRYFKSDMETLRRAENDIGARTIHDCYTTVSEFYNLVGLKPTSVSDNQGWSSDKLMELRFSTCLTESGDPCLAFDYNYVKPLVDLSLN